MKKVWKAGIEVPSLVRRVVKVLVPVRHRAKTCLHMLSAGEVKWHVKGHLPSPQKKDNPEIPRREICKPARITLLNLVDRSVRSSMQAVMHVDHFRCAMRDRSAT